jgi:flagellar biosynthesis/type III secretory pathway protein FliH
MADSSSNCPCPDDISCHRFPDLGDAPSCLRPPSGGDDHGTFKPLYQSTIEGRQAGGADETLERVTQVRQIRYKAGFEEGQQNACLLAREQIAPEVDAFAGECAHFSEYAEQLQTQSCNQICVIAVRFAEKILGRPPCLTSEDLSRFKAELKRHMSGLYQLNLGLNPEDRHQLLCLMAEQRADWKPGTSMITIDAEAEIEPGALKAQQIAEPLALIGILSELLNQILAEASTS